jgi:hypothetical protein
MACHGLHAPLVGDQGRCQVSQVRSGHARSFKT